MRLLTTLVATLSLLTVFAQPANDACSNAASLPCGTSNLAGTTVSSVSETHGTGCTMSGYGVWYTFTGNGYPTTISTIGTGGFDQEMAVASGSCGSLTNLACRDVNGGNGSETYTFTTVNGTNYYVYVGHYATGATTGTFTISRTCATPPTNDDCASATNLPCGTSNLAGSTVSTTSETPGTGCTLSGNGVWYSFAGDGYQTTISTTGTGGFDQEMAIVSGSCGAFTNLACRDVNGGNGIETYTFNTSIGTTYYVYVSHYAVGSTTGTFTISRSCVIPPSNDNCSSATNLPCGTTNLAGTTVGTSSETPGTGCTLSGNGVWYSFTGDGNISTISTTGTGGFDQEIAIVSGSCGSFTNIACRDINGSNGNESYTFTTVNGTNYYVYVAHYATGTTTGTFTISHTCTPAPVPPSNDACASATNLPCGTSALAGTTVNSVSETAPSSCGMSNYGVWYTFTGDGDITTLTLQGTGGFDTGLGLYSGSCGSLTNITCEDAFAASDPETYTFTTVNGVNYYLYVAYYTSGSTTGTFTISRSCTPAPTPPVNDNCASATSLPCETSGLAGTTVNSASESAPSTCGMSNYGVWYTFTGDGGITSLTLQGTGGFDTGLGLYSGSCGSLTNITCEDAFSASDPETYSFTTTNGVNYYIYVAYFTSGSTTGAFTISRTCPGPSSQDCPNAVQICDDQSLSGNSSGYGSVQELNSSNYGCIAGGMSEQEDQSSWYYFQATNNGTVELVLNSNPGVDYDFLIWGPNSSCGSLGSPIRCDASEVDEITGMVTINPDNGSTVTNTSSNPGATSTWVKSLDVTTGQFYIMMINNFTSNSTPFTVDWTFSVPDLLNCDPIPLPVAFNDFSGYNHNNNNLLFWTSFSEKNNAYYSIERSIDAINWEVIHNEAGAINSSEELNYSYVDRGYMRNKINYYRLSQTDLDGNHQQLKTIYIDNSESAKVIMNRYNLLGQEVNEYYRGVVILQFADGTTMKVLQ